MLKTLGVFAIGILAMEAMAQPASAAGGLYKWQDATGWIHFTQTPPPPGATLLEGPKGEATRPIPKGDVAPKAAEGGSTGGARGMTWGTVDARDLPSGTVNVACIGGPPPANARWTHQGNCNPYRGDTSCSASLPLLCYKPDGSKPPPGLVKTGFHEGWAEGSVATTVPVKGSALSSRQAADDVCRSTMGGGWRMAEFHDGSGGWGFTANGRVNAQSRFWVHINDQPGNCWDPQPSSP
jgi:hypothetical protein